MESTFIGRISLIHNSAKYVKSSPYSQELQIYK